MFELKKLEDLLMQGKINRREFIKRISALGLAASVSPYLLSKPAFAGSPKKGGRLRIGSAGGATTNNLEPGTIDDAFMMLVSYSVRNCLCEIDHQGNLIPELAESWEARSGAAEWVFKLRKGVEFHNGKTLDAPDVLYSINHHRGEKSKSAHKPLVKSIKEVIAPDKHTVKITLEEGDADFPFKLTSFRIPIFPAEANPEDGMGSGGYIIEKFEPGVNILMNRNPNYWKAGRAHFDEVEILAITDEQARTNAIRTGQVDVINRLDRKTAHLMKKVPGIDVFSEPQVKHLDFPMHYDVPPFNNNDVRLGLKYAIDREKILKIILRGYGSLANDNPIGSMTPYFAKDLPQRHYDPDKAKYHLKKAGVENDTFTLHTSNGAFDGAVDAAVLYQQAAADAGIKINVKREPADGYWSDVWLKKPWCATYWLRRATCDWTFTVAFSAGAPWNDSRFNHAKFEKLLKEARVELDQKKRGEMYAEMQRIVKDEGSTVTPVFADHIGAASKKLAHNEIASNWELDGSKIAERWWFES